MQQNALDKDKKLGHRTHRFFRWLHHVSNLTDSDRTGSSARSRERARQQFT